MEIIYALVGTLGCFIVPLAIGGYGTLGRPKFDRQAVVDSITDPIADHFRRWDVSMTQNLIVSPGFSLTAIIGAGKYDFVDKYVSESRLYDNPKSVGEWEWKFFNAEQTMGTEDAAAAIIADGWQPARIEHLLAFGEKYPDEQRSYEILAIGSVWRINLYQGVPRLWLVREKRTLDLDSSKHCFPGVRLLAVRKV